jgi:hypothetical protein
MSIGGTVTTPSVDPAAGFPVPTYEYFTLLDSLKKTIARLV